MCGCRVDSYMHANVLSVFLRSASIFIYLKCLTMHTTAWYNTIDLKILWSKKIKTLIYIYIYKYTRKPFNDFVVTIKCYLFSFLFYTNDSTDFIYIYIFHFFYYSQNIQIKAFYLIPIMKSFFFYFTFLLQVTLRPRRADSAAVECVPTREPKYREHLSEVLRFLYFLFRCNGGEEEKHQRQVGARGRGEGTERGDCAVGKERQTGRTSLARRHPTCSVAQGEQPECTRE